LLEQVQRVGTAWVVHQAQLGQRLEAAEDVVVPVQGVVQFEELRMDGLASGPPLVEAPR
jgi:hypothetical protein